MKKNLHTIIASLLFLVCLSFIACSDSDKAEISQVMDSRDHAISNRNIPEYSALIASDYSDHGHKKVDILAQMISLFDKFEQAEMTSYDRHIRQLSDVQAQCEQSYTLKVFADNQWRKIVQREQITLNKTSAGWKISSGL